MGAYFSGASSLAPASARRALMAAAMFPPTRPTTPGAAKLRMSGFATKNVFGGSGEVGTDCKAAAGAAGAGGGELCMADDGDASDKNMMKAFGVMMGIAKMAGILNFSQIKEDDVSMGTLTEYATVFELESLRG